MKVLIVEDEELAIEKLRQLIARYPISIDIVDVLDSVKSTVHWFQHASIMPDLVLMDIHLSDGLSFEIFKQVQVSPPVIFITAYDQYALKAFKANGIDYLLKPIDYDDFRGSLDKFQEKYGRQSSIISEEAVTSKITELLDQFKHLQKEDYKSRFLVKSGNKLVPIAVDQIAYFYKDEIVFLLTAENKKFHVNYSLDELERILNPKIFFRANRQFIVHIQSIESIHPYFKGKLKLRLKPVPSVTDEVIISQEKSSRFKDWVDW